MERGGDGNLPQKRRQTKQQLGQNARQMQQANQRYLQEAGAFEEQQQVGQFDGEQLQRAEQKGKKLQQSSKRRQLGE